MLPSMSLGLWVEDLGFLISQQTPTSYHNAFYHSEAQEEDSAKLDGCDSLIWLSYICRVN